MVKQQKALPFLVVHRTMVCQEFSGSLVVRTWCFYCRGPGFNPWLGN